MKIVFKEFFYALIGKRTHEDKDRERIKLLKELLALKAQLETQKSNDPAHSVSREFLLDALTVALKDGTVLASNETQAFERAVKSSSILQFVENHYPKAQMVVVKQDGHYHFICHDENKMYLLKSSAEIPAVETRVIMQKLKKKLKTRKE